MTNKSDGEIPASTPTHGCYPRTIDTEARSRLLEFSVDPIMEKPIGV